MEASPAHSAGGHTNRGRNRASIALAVVGAVLAVIGVLLLYVRVELVDEDAFADHTVTALKDDRVRELAATEIVVQLVERGSPDLVAARPLLEQVVSTVIDAGPFQQIFREAGKQTNRLLFVKEHDNVAFDVADGLQIVRFALQSINPKLADDLPKSIDLALLKLKERDFASGTLEFAASIRWLGLVAPLIAILVLLGAGPARARPAPRDPAGGARDRRRGRRDRDRLPDPACAHPRGGDRDRGGDRSGRPRRGRWDPGRVPRRPVHVGARARAGRLRRRWRGRRARPGPHLRSGSAAPAGHHPAPGGHPRAAGARRRRGASPASSSRSTGSSRSASSACSPAPISSTSAQASCSCSSAAAGRSRRRRARCAGAASGARSPSSPSAWESSSPR